MKKTNKKKRSETSRLLARWAMELSNHLRYKEGWNPDVATRQAWVCQHCLEALGRGEVMMMYVKKDGSTRIARGTLAAGVSEAYDRYEYKDKPDGGIRQSEDGRWTFCYWDLDEEAFRSFNAARLNDYLEVRGKTR